MSVKVSLSRGSTILSGDGAVNNSSSDTEKMAVVTTQGVKDVDLIVVNIVKSAKARIVMPTVAASVITGRIRVRFVDAIRNNKKNEQFGYEIQSFKYLDEILFNDLQYIIQSIINFGSKSTLTLNQIMKMITDTSNVIEYYIPEEDYEDIRNILGVLFNEF